MVSPYDILVLNVGVDTNMTEEGVVCGLNLVCWVVSSVEFRGIEMTKFLEPPRNLLKISLLCSCYFTLPIT